MPAPLKPQGCVPMVPSRCGSWPFTAAHRLPTLLAHRRWSASADWDPLLCPPTEACSMSCRPQQSHSRCLPAECSAPAACTQPRAEHTALTHGGCLPAERLAPDRCIQPRPCLPLNGDFCSCGLLHSQPACSTASPHSAQEPACQTSTHESSLLCLPAEQSVPTLCITWIPACRTVGTHSMRFLDPLPCACLQNDWHLCSAQPGSLPAAGRDEGACQLCLGWIP